MSNLSLEQRSTEIADFFQIPLEDVLARLRAGFGPNHQAVSEDFEKFFRGSSRSDDAALLEWYRQTKSYIFELTAYHLDPGFNYDGMCKGIADRLDDYEIDNVLVLGDGIGDLTLYLIERGFNAVYHDLAGSCTAAFAAFHFFHQTGRGDFPNMNTNGWEPNFPENHFNAVVCCDFLEHVTNVEEWVRAINFTLTPGGLFMAQNAFGIGDEEHGGDMPMHLSRNNRFEKDWDPFLDSLGLLKLSDNWRAKPFYERVIVEGGLPLDENSDSAIVELDESSIQEEIAASMNALKNGESTLGETIEKLQGLLDAARKQTLDGIFNRLEIQIDELKQQFDRITQEFGLDGTGRNATASTNLSESAILAKGTHPEIPEPTWEMHAKADEWKETTDHPLPPIVQSFELDQDKNFEVAAKEVTETAKEEQEMAKTSTPEKPMKEHPKDTPSVQKTAQVSPSKKNPKSGAKKR